MTLCDCTPRFKLSAFLSERVFFKLDRWWTLRFVLLLFHDTNSCSCVVVLRCGISEYYNHSQTLCCLRSVAYLSDDDGTGDDVTVGSCVKPPRWGDASFGKHLMSLSHESRSSVNVFPVPLFCTHTLQHLSRIAVHDETLHESCDIISRHIAMSYHEDCYTLKEHCK